MLRGWTLHTAGEPPYEVDPADHDPMRAGRPGPRHRPGPGLAVGAAGHRGATRCRRRAPARRLARRACRAARAVRGLGLGQRSRARPRRAEGPAHRRIRRPAAAGRRAGRPRPRSSGAAPVLRLCEAARPPGARPSRARWRRDAAGAPAWWAPVVDYPAQLQAAWWAWHVAGRGLLPDAAGVLRRRRRAGRPCTTSASPPRGGAPLRRRPRRLRRHLVLRPAGHRRARPARSASTSSCSAATVRTPNAPDLRPRRRRRARDRVVNPQRLLEGGHR